MKPMATWCSTFFPPYLTGFFAAVMVGAILSSFNSALNSTTTLFSLGIYKGVINKNADEAQVVKVGKIFGWIMAIAAMVIAPLLAGQESLFSYLQTMNAIYFIPILAVVLVGLLTKRVPAIAAKVGLVAGCLLIAAGYFIPPFNKILDVTSQYHFVAGVFVLLIAIMLIIGKVYPRETKWVHQDAGEVDLTPWKGAWPVGLVLVLCVIAIYAAFAG